MSLKSTHKAAGLKASSSLPEGWTEHTAPTGHKYYYNASTRQSTYTRPALEQPAAEEEPLFAEEAAPDPITIATLRAQDEFARNSSAQAHPGHFTGGKSYQQRPQRRGHGGDRPKRKKAIPGSEPWVLVYTKFGRRFVHNTETSESLWKFPQDVMMAVIEMESAEWKAKQSSDQQKDSGTAEPKPAQAEVASATKDVAGAEDKEDGGYDSSEYEEVEVTDDEADGEDNTSKRPRLSPSQAQDADAPSGPAEMTEDDIAWQLAQMEADDDEDNYDDPLTGDEADPDDEEAGGLEITHEDNLALFRSLLDEASISPYATFESLLTDPRLVEDDRWVSLPNMSSRRDAFAHWSRDRVAQEKERLASQPAPQPTDPRITYLRFLSEKASTKLFWPEFKRKWKREEIMRGYEPSEKEREKLYREFVAKLKVGAGQRRKELGEVLKGTARASEVPEAVLRDVRYWVVGEKERDEVVGAWKGS